MSVPGILTWYANGEPLPWRLAREDGEGTLRGEQRCDTFAEMLVEFGERWAREMPEPTPSTPTP